MIFIRHGNTRKNTEFRDIFDMIALSQTTLTAIKPLHGWFLSVSFRVFPWPMRIFS